MYLMTDAYYHVRFVTVSDYFPSQNCGTSDHTDLPIRNMTNTGRLFVNANF